MPICKGCKTDFLSDRKKSKYHNRECFLKATIRLQICPECGDEFKKKFRGQVCCTTKCAYKYIAKKNTKGKSIQCTFCGKSVHKMPSRMHDKNNFCNRSCTVAYLRSPQNTSMSKGWHHTKEAKEKISKAGIGRKPTQENIEKLKVANAIRIWTKEQRDAARQRKLGVKNTDEQNRKIKANAKRGWKNKSWKGRYAGYTAKHLAMKQRMGGVEECVNAITDGHLCTRRLEASNKNHLYFKQKEHWKRRCSFHHRKYDWQYGLFNPKGKAKRFVANFGNTHMREITVDGIIIEREEVITSYS